MTPAAANPPTGAIVMAAGAGRRMGNVPKSLLRRDGEPLLLRQIRLLADAGADVLVVVLGHHAARLTAMLDAARARAAPGMDRVGWVVNQDPDRGTGSSLRCGLTALPDGLSTWLVALGDQPLLEVDDVRTVLDAWRTRAHGVELVQPQHAGRLGHPVVFGRAVRDAVLREPATEGVREWRRAHPDQVRKLPAAHARYTADVDTPDDILRLRAEQGVKLDWPPGDQR